MGLPIVFSIISLFLAGAGTFIWKKEAIWLLSNFPKDETKIRDKKGLVKWAGMFLYLIAILIIIIGFTLFQLADTKFSMVPMAVFIPVASILTVLYIVGVQRFLHKN